MSGSRKEISRYHTTDGKEVVLYSDGSSAQLNGQGVVVQFDLVEPEKGYPGVPVMDPLWADKQRELEREGCSRGWAVAEVPRGAMDQGNDYIPTIVTANMDPLGLGQHTPGAKLDGGKLRWHLLPLSVIEGVVRIMTFGAEKYTEDGWKSVPEAKERYFSAMMRHWCAMQRGETTDPESGLPHYYHFLCNAVFLTWFFEQDDQKEYDKDDA